MSRASRRIFLQAAVLLGMTACRTVPEEHPLPARPHLPTRWAQPGNVAKPSTSTNTTTTTTATSADPLSCQWWRSFGSEELNGLITQAIAQSHDLAASAARVREVRARHDALAGSRRSPTVSTGFSATRESRLGGNAEVDGNEIGINLSASYEFDFWGRKQLAVDHARATLAASMFEHDTVRLTLTAAVAEVWIQMVSLRERIAIEARSLDNARQRLAFLQSRWRAGAASALEVAEGRRQHALQTRNLLALKQQEIEARQVLGLLLGQADAVPARTDSLIALRIPAISAGVPAELLVRRPDVAQAEARLAAASADVQLARVALLPRFAITTGVRTVGEQLQRPLENPVYTLAAGLVAPLLDGGRLKGELAAALAGREALVAEYHHSIVTAFADVAVALNAVQAAAAQSASQAEELEEAGQTVVLSQSRHRAGAETRLHVLEAQGLLLAAEDMAVQLRTREFLTAISLYKALGGGWQSGRTASGGRSGCSADMPESRGKPPVRS